MLEAWLARRQVGRSKPASFRLRRNKLTGSLTRCYTTWWFVVPNNERANDGHPMARGSDTVRRGNLSTILRSVHADGESTRAALTATTGLNRSTVADLVRELADRGLVSEGEPLATGAPGRPSPTVAVRTDRVFVLALDVKVDSIAAAAVTLGGQRLYTARLERSRTRTSVAATLDDLTALAQEVSDPLPRRQRLVGVGASVTGLVHRTEGVVEVAPNLGWQDVAFAELLRERLGRRVPVAVSNDGDAGALAERVHGAARGVDHLVYLSGEVGIGGGIIVGGRPLAGAVGYAGEIGHLPIDVAGPECGCGSRGCWETLIGEAALLRFAGRPPDGGLAAAREIVAAAERGDTAVLAALDELGGWIGLGLASLVNVLNPQRIVLGGLYSRLFPYVAGPARAAMAARSLVATRSAVDLVPAALGEDSSLVGAAEEALQPLLDDPSAAPRGRLATGEQVGRV